MDKLCTENEIKKENCLYCLLFVLALIAMYCAVTVNFGDDVNAFIKVWDNYANTFDYLAHRYHAWSSRTVIEALLVYFVQNVFLWKTASIAVTCLLAYSLYELSNKSSLFGVTALLLLYRLREMASAGWVATTLNYYWPLAFGFYSLVIIHKLVHEQEIRLAEIIFSFGALFIGISNEQYCAVHLALLTLYTAYALINKRFSKPYGVIIAGHYLITIMNLIYIFTCPGNYSRKASEVRSWMRNFYEKTLVDQLIDGYKSTMSTLLSSKNIIFMVFVSLLFICVWKKTKDFRCRLLAGIPLTVAFIVSFGNTISNGFFADIVTLVTDNSGVTAANWNVGSGYVTLAVYVLISGCIVSCFFLLFDDLSMGLTCTFLFALAIASRIIMGFSPTLFASSNRTFLFCYGIIILIMLKMYENLKYLFSDQEITYGKYAAALLCIAITLQNIAEAI